ncbi:MAG: TonB-dependent receptor [Candidatus Aminicenantes bacterium]|nr:MAG: TonB-dependent receptor [Candidatus Aminicenantes bacterium]
MRKSLLSILIILSLTGFGFSASSRTIKGRVLDEKGNPLANVKVEVLDTAISTHTKPNGIFVLENLKKKKIFVMFIHPDYVTRTVELAMEKSSGQMIEISLTPKNPILMTIKEEISVTAEADSIIDINLPSHRTILPNSVLTEMGTSNIAESVDKVPGVAAVGKGGYSMVPAIRGLAEHRTLLLVDGVRITSERRLGASASFVSLGAIDRVEINRGPYSVFHGSGALGGIINIITKSPAPKSPFEGDFRLGYNTVRNERAGSVSLSGSLGNWGLMFGSNGKKADDYAAPSGKIEWSRYQDYDLMFKINRQSKKSEFYATIFHYNGTDIGKPSPTSYLKPRWYPDETNSLLMVGYRTEKFWILDKINASVYALRSVLETQKDNLREETLSVEKRNLARVEGTNFGFKIRGGKTLGKIHTLNFGIDYFGRANINDQNTEWKYDEMGNVISLADESSLQDARRNNLGFYIDDKIKFSDLVTLNVGTRFDTVSTSNLTLEGNRITKNDEFFSAYLGTVFQITPYLSFLGNVGHSFRFPSVSELFYTGLTGRGTVFGNPDLEPEKSLNLDIGFRYLHEKFFASIYGFSNSINDMIQKYGGFEEEEYFYRNLTSGQIYGFEGEFYLSLMKNVELFINFHHMVGKEKGEKNTDAALNYIPPSRLTFWGKYSPGKFWVEPRVTLTSAVRDPGPLEIEIDGYVLFDTIFGLKINDSLTLVAIAQNIFDQTYRASADEAGVDAPGQGFVFKAEYSF